MYLQGMMLNETLAIFYHVLPGVIEYLLPLIMFIIDRMKCLRQIPVFMLAVQDTNMIFTDDLLILQSFKKKCTVWV
jgi:hypothetical protein